MCKGVNYNDSDEPRLDGGLPKQYAKSNSIKSDSTMQIFPAWENTNFDESPDPLLNNVDNESKEIQEKERYRQDTKHRDYLVHWVVYTNSAWLIAVMLVLISHGAYDETTKFFHLSDGVIMTLLGTTTANILGLAYIVLKGLFPLPKD